MGTWLARFAILVVVFSLMLAAVCGILIGMIEGAIALGFSPNVGVLAFCALLVCILAASMAGQGE